MATKSKEDKTKRVSRNKLGRRERNIELTIDHTDPVPRKFTCHWINRLDQFETSDVTLLITDNNGVIPPQRIEKNFNIANKDYDAFDADALATESELEIDRIVQEWMESNPA